MIFDAQKNDYRISTDRSKLDLLLIHDFLKNSYWAKNISYEKVKKSIENSLCFGLFEKEKQIGFARVITDYSRIAYLADVFVLESYRKFGLGKWLVETLMKHPDLQDLTKWILVTKDAHELYRKFGFENLHAPESYMEISNQSI